MTQQKIDIFYRGFLNGVGKEHASQIQNDLTAKNAYNKERTRLKAAFKRFDLDHSGTCSVRAFVGSLRSSSLQIRPEVIENAKTRFAVRPLYEKINYADFLEQLTYVPSTGECTMTRGPSMLRSRTAAGTRKATTSDHFAADNTKIRGLAAHQRSTTPSDVSSRVSKTSSAASEFQLGGEQLRAAIKSKYSIMQQAFRDLDKDNNGVLSQKELADALKLFRIKHSPSFVRGLMQEFDLGSDSIDYEQFLRFMMQSDLQRTRTRARSVSPTKKLSSNGVDATRALQDRLRTKYKLMRKAFRDIDENHNGSIDVSELKRVLEIFNMPLSIKEVQKIMSTVDHNHDGQISYEEFMQLMAEKETMLKESMGHH